MSDDVVISLRDVEVHFENSGSGIFDLFSDPETVHAVDGVSLDIHENEVIALVGESGCGKTTLGKTAIGLQRPTGGSVEYRGQDIQEAQDGEGEIEIPYWEIRRSLQIIHQDPGSSLNPNRKVAAILESPLKKWEKHLSSADRRARVLGLLERVGMTPPDDYAQRYPHQLSGGEKQRVALIRALLLNPDLILADEAISALDVSLRIEMMDLMHRLQDLFDTSFLFISHDFSNARYMTEKVGGRIGVMYLGELVEIGTAEEIAENPKHPYTQALRWATPDFETMARHDEMPIRKIDIPDPIDPPAGCRFHTRCPKVIPPEGLAVSTDEWHRVLDFRLDVKNGLIDVPETPDTDTAEQRQRIRSDASLSERLSDPEAESALAAAVQTLVDGDRDVAIATLDEHFTSPCERSTPPAAQIREDHAAACLLYTDGSSAETTDTSVGEAVGD